MDRYPFTRCLHPRKIVNPYTRESLIVECGSCPACSLRKSSVAAIKVKLESLSHKYCMFITLTYNNVSLPRMLLHATNMFKDDAGEVQDTREDTALVDITTRLGTQGTVIGLTTDDYFIKTKLSKKVELPTGILPCLSKYDAQLFIKRLRINIERYFENTYYETETPKIRYYLAGEYGPKHFRPHYHVLLWFEDDRLYQAIRQIVHKSWRFGRIDIQKSRGKCADYVAKYLNSSVPLPQVFKFRSIRPFSLHSTHLGEKVFEAEREEIYSSEYRKIITRSIPHYSTTTDVVMWRSLKTHFFPKCKSFSNLTEQERLYVYSTYVYAYRWTGETSISAQARIVVNALLCRFYHVGNFEGSLYFDNKLLDYFFKSSMFNPWNFEGKSFNTHVDDVYRRIYMELRLSKYFHKYVCKGFINLYKPMINKIDKFWTDADMDNLSNQLTSQSEFVNSVHFESIDDLQFFYHNTMFDFDKFSKTKAYRTFASVTSHNALYAVKHKHLNDLNRIFL